jgi:hypothetical protein
MLVSNLCRDTGYPEVLHGSPQFLTVNTGIVPQLGHDRFLPNPLKFVYHPSIRSYTVQLLKVPLNNPQKKKRRNAIK